jgi:hypothetical protein
MAKCNVLPIPTSVFVFPSFGCNLLNCLCYISESRFNPCMRFADRLDECDLQSSLNLPTHVSPTWRRRPSLCLFQLNLTALFRPCRCCSSLQLLLFASPSPCSSPTSTSPTPETCWSPTALTKTTSSAPRGAILRPSAIVTFPQIRSQDCRNHVWTPFCAQQGIRLNPCFPRHRPHTFITIHAFLATDPTLSSGHD